MAPKPSTKAIFIYGGGTSVDAAEFKLAEAEGVSVLTVGGEHNCGYCKAHGEGEISDYKNSGGLITYRCGKRK